jgi:polar amino acid transport system ATP-binding protein
LIRFIAANKWFNSHHVLKNINLEISKGEVIVICGPSGAGKSTLLRTINKLEPIDDGEIIVDGMYLSFSISTFIRIKRQLKTSHLPPARSGD